MEILSLDQEIQERAREQMSDHQRDYYLREQIKAIQTELGEEADEIEEYRERIAKADLPNEVREKLNKELGRRYSPAGLSGRLPGAALGEENPGEGECFRGA